MTVSTEVQYIGGSATADCFNHPFVFSESDEESTLMASTKGPKVKLATDSHVTGRGAIRMLGSWRKCLSLQ